VAEETDDKVRAAADRVLELASELEAHGDASFDGEALDKARAALHRWIDSVTAVVALPAFGRVTLIHADGRQSTISSSHLSYAMSEPASGATVR
jgi:hypothetical protein